jgi:predicted GIY-YIG superfamily endonuclease
MGEYLVYMHRCPNGKVYIGITSCSPNVRWKDGYGYKEHKKFYHDIIKYGWDNIQHLILFDGLSMNEALEKEKELIAKYNACDENFGYNIKEGGQAGPIKVDNPQKREKRDNRVLRMRTNDIMMEQLAELCDFYGICKEYVIRMLIAKDSRDKMLFGIDYKETRLIDKQRKEDEKNG